MPTRTARPRLTATMAALTCAVTVSAMTGCGGDVARSPLQDLVSARTVPGAAELSQDAQGALRFATAGVSDVRSGRPIGLTDRFRAGSITKTVIAVVVLQLAAEHRLKVDDPVTGHLPQPTADAVRRVRYGRDVTVRQLLTHTSGLFSYTDDLALFHDVTDHRLTAHSPETLVRTAVAHAPYAPPGARYHYSNTDYLLLGMVIRQVTGHSYATEALRRVITPLRLSGTSFPGTRTTLPAPHGRAYSASAGGSPRDVTELNPSVAGAAGEMVSTLPDLNRLFAALLGGELLAAPELRTMLDTKATGGRYGMGVFPVRLPCRRTVWGHNGEINGSYVQTLGTADGRHVVSYRVNSDTRPPTGAEAELLREDFCSRPDRDG
ncbi:serine hydrolase domain-containing protein [Streptomyces cinnamoneus]|uniref:Serine hydrolase n=1 Tax=Streptomyces cinnamoneus TaxID=53446 RepID=A0A918WL74_STRCJ|nr:serine hydrolase domain-containing protein [Streptomyces cinnamoneus]GHC61751.1 serine hydrolase [Streptomyces cinnamoneus]